ncbi:FtsX-like permease family protein [Bacillus sp. 166amftsu]|uniref:FtsX-like permease family protein n=1 Tax=Bacillus sp. 166amftsu TaxID=1761753 RepID=UPI0008962A69|nr:FtsX-like permease family protein [Bacillus sp. 166amftsu]SDZ41270.1 putative ABC transport system permease protein [Bacillus sp. 166amftsu]
MNFRQFASNNVIRNKRLYLGHFLSSTFAVMIFFTFELLAFHPYFSGKIASTSATMTALGTQGFKIAQYLIMFFSFFFILYSVNAFLKTRKREFGVVILLGMTNSQLKRLIFIENMLIGCCAIIAGIGIGLIFGKIVLLASANLLALKGRLLFYLPTKAIVVTCLSFLILFILVSVFTARMMKVSQLIELMKSEEKPKQEPKSSKWLALLSILFIAIGYAAAFYLYTSLWRGDSFVYVMLICVFFSVLGTYFLFTQLSFYLLKYVKKREHTFFKKTNLLTISELAYRMMDNAKTLFLVSILSAVTFTSIGVCLSIGSNAVAESQSPYAFSYTSYNGNVEETSHISQIKKQLNDADFSYKLISPTIFTTENTADIMKLTDYNASAKILGYPVETLQNEQDSLILPSKSRLRGESQDEFKKEISSYTLQEGDIRINVSGKKLLMDNALSPSFGYISVVSDSVYEKIINTPPLQKQEHNQYTQYGFLIKNWTKTEDISKQFMKMFPYDSEKMNPPYKFESLYLKWLEGKQANGLLSIISVLVGIVFFVFAISFLYFRLFTDLDRDKKQYEMLSKVGLTQKELKKIVTQQISILFFVPIVVAIIHSSVAFGALQYLAQRKYIDLSVTGNSILIFTSFICVQIIYFLIIRRNYLRQILQSIH